MIILLRNNPDNLYNLDNSDNPDSSIISYDSHTPDNSDNPANPIQAEWRATLKASPVILSVYVPYIYHLSPPNTLIRDKKHPLKPVLAQQLP